MTDQIYLTVRLPLRIGPMDRAELWEEPLAEQMEQAGLGVVSGGGTMMSPDGDILFCELELELPDLTDDRLNRLQSLFETLGAPRKTQFLSDEETALREFGTISVVGVGLDGTGLPDSTYAEFDSEAFDAEVQEALGAEYSYGGSQAEARYTFFYYHGPDANHIENILRSVVTGKPIGVGAQINRIA